MREFEPGKVPEYLREYLSSREEIITSVYRHERGCTMVNFEGGGLILVDEQIEKFNLKDFLKPGTKIKITELGHKEINNIEVVE